MFFKLTPANGSRGGAWGARPHGLPPPPPYFQKKKGESQKEEKPAGQAKKTGLHFSLRSGSATEHCPSIKSFMCLSFPTHSLIDRCRIVIDTFQKKNVSKFALKPF